MRIYERVETKDDPMKLPLALLCLVLLACSAAHAADSRPPNIIFILADDKYE